MTMIGAVALDGIRALMSVDTAMDGAVYRAFVEHQLIPNLKPGDIVVMDNLSVHKNAAALRAIEQASATVLFLPPYSPEFNPIEKVWAKLKEILRRASTLTRDIFDAALGLACRDITNENMRAWIIYAGYRFTSS